MRSEAGIVKTRMSRGRKRPVANREQILAAAREIGVRDGWRAVTIRAVALKLGYTAPVLYEHFGDKEEVLTQVAMEGLSALHRELRREAEDGSEPGILLLAERYWNFMLKETQIYRLMNGIGGVPVNGSALAEAARHICEVTGKALQKRPAAENAAVPEEGAVVDAVWALLHGMASLYLGRAARFGLPEVRQNVLWFVAGASVRER